MIVKINVIDKIYLTIDFFVSCQIIKPKPFKYFYQAAPWVVYVVQGGNPVIPNLDSYLGIVSCLTQTQTTTAGAIDNSQLSCNILWKSIINKYSTGWPPDTKAKGEWSL